MMFSALQGRHQEVNCIQQHKLHHQVIRGVGSDIASAGSGQGLLQELNSCPELRPAPLSQGSPVHLAHLAVRLVWQWPLLSSTRQALLQAAA